MSKGYPSGYDLSMLRMYARAVARGEPRPVGHPSADVREVRSRLESAGLLEIVDGKILPTDAGESAVGAGATA